MNQTHKEKTVKQYHRLKITFFLINFFITVGFLFLFVYLQGAHALRDVVIEKIDTPWIQVIFYATSLSLMTYFLETPINFFGDYLLEKHYGLSTLTLGNWCTRELKKTLLSLVLFLLLVETGYGLVWSMKEKWWIGFGSLWFIYSWLLAQIFPIWIIPLFYRYSPVRDEALILTLKTFALSQGRNIDSVKVLNLSKETKKANAAVLGIGKRKRIVLGDTLLNRFNHEEIKVIFAHELGHDKERHLLMSLLFNAIVIFGGIYSVKELLLRFLPFFRIVYFDDLAVLPLFLFFFSLFSVVSMPIQNGFSRFMEQRADAFALRTTGLKDVFVSAMKKLSEQNLADEHPNRWVEIFFHSHPSISRRIEFAKRF